MTIGLILNANCRESRLHPKRGAALATILSGRGTVRETRSMSDLEAAIADFRSQNIGHIAVVGGDGTIHTTVTQTIHEYRSHGLAVPVFSLLSGGTMNIVAHSVGVGACCPERHLKSLLNAVDRGVARRETRNLLKVAGRYGFLFGAGVIERFLAEFYRGSEQTPLTAAATLVRALGGTIGIGTTLSRVAQPFVGSITVDENGVSKHWGAKSYLAVAGGTVEQLGFGFRPFWRCNEQPNTFHILGVTTTPARLARYLGHIWLGRNLPESVAYQATASRVVLRSDKPIAYMFDGELYEGGTELEVEVAEKINFLCS